MLALQGFLCKQWLERILKGCQLPFPLALQPGEKAGLLWCCWGHRGCKAAVMLLQDHFVPWHPQGGFVFIPSPELQEGWVSSVPLKCRVCSLQ